MLPFTKQVTLVDNDIACCFLAMFHLSWTRCDVERIAEADVAMGPSTGTAGLRLF